MIALFISPINETKAIVTGIHYMPEMLAEEEKANGILVDSIPEPESLQLANNKMPIHYINPQMKEQWYEYVDRPLTTEEEIEKLKQENATMQDTINFLLGL